MNSINDKVKYSSSNDKTVSVTLRQNEGAPLYEAPVSEKNFIFQVRWSYHARLALLKELYCAIEIM